jgi:hypothetical protein
MRPPETAHVFAASTVMATEATTSPPSQALFADAGLSVRAGLGMDRRVGQALPSLPCRDDQLPTLGRSCRVRKAVGLGPADSPFGLRLTTPKNRVLFMLRLPGCWGCRGRRRRLPPGEGHYKTAMVRR